MQVYAYVNSCVNVFRSLRRFSCDFGSEAFKVRCVGLNL